MASCVYGDGLPIFFIYIYMDIMASGRCYYLIWVFIPFFKQGSMIAHRAVAKMGDANPYDKLVWIGQFSKIGAACFDHQINMLTIPKIQHIILHKKAVHGCIK